jgi:hypothetical protein
MTKQEAIMEFICRWENDTGGHGDNPAVRQEAVKFLLDLGVSQQDIDAAVKSMDDRFRELLNTKG